MQKCLLLSLFLIFTSYAMEHRCSSQDLRERRHTRSGEYKVFPKYTGEQKKVSSGEAGDAYDALACVEHECTPVHAGVLPRSGGWGKMMSMATLCTLLLTAQAGCMYHDGRAGCELSTDYDLILFAEKHPDLTIIDLSRNYQITINSIQKLPMLCPNLRSILLYEDTFRCSGEMHVSDEDIAKIHQWYPHIRIYRNSLDERVEHERECIERQRQRADEEIARNEAQDKLVDDLHDKIFGYDPFWRIGRIGRNR